MFLLEIFSGKIRTSILRPVSNTNFESFCLDVLSDFSSDIGKGHFGGAQNDVCVKITTQKRSFLKVIPKMILKWCIYLFGVIFLCSNFHTNVILRPSEMTLPDV
jgi:hypothetical protein